MSTSSISFTTVSCWKYPCNNSWFCKYSVISVMIEEFIVDNIRIMSIFWFDCILFNLVCFQFSDMLLYTSRTAMPSLQFKVHGQLPLRGMIVCTSPITFLHFFFLFYLHKTLTYSVYFNWHSGYNHLSGRITFKT